MEADVTEGLDIDVLAWGARAKARCDALGLPPYSEVEGQLTRRFLTPAHAAALTTLSEWMAAAGMSKPCVKKQGLCHPSGECILAYHYPCFVVSLS